MFRRALAILAGAVLICTTIAIDNADAFRGGGRGGGGFRGGAVAVRGGGFRGGGAYRGGPSRYAAEHIVAVPTAAAAIGPPTGPAPIAVPGTAPIAATGMAWARRPSALRRPEPPTTATIAAATTPTATTSAGTEPRRRTARHRDGFPCPPGVAPSVRFRDLLSNQDASRRRTASDRSGRAFSPTRARRHPMSSNTRLAARSTRLIYHTPRVRLAACEETG